MRFILLCFCFLTRIHVALLQKQQSPCGEWTPYKSELCIKIMERNELQTKDDAEAICHSLGCGNEQVPGLITVKTQEKQDFVKKLLFDDGKLVDDVWLGLDLGKHIWNDGTNLKFTNWNDQITSNSKKLPILRPGEKSGSCVGMRSGANGHPVGIWNRANCKVKKLVVCEKIPPTLSYSLQKEISDLKVAMERQEKDAEERITKFQEESEQKLSATNMAIDALKQSLEENANTAQQDAHGKIDAINQEILATKNATEKEFAAATGDLNTLEQDPVPIGFTYIEIPGVKSPQKLWPQLKWKNVSPLYAGLFFRVVGGNAASFGTEQYDNTRYVSGVISSLYTHSDIQNMIEVTIPEDGTWSSPPLWTGSNYIGYTEKQIGLQFKTTTGEVRPRNMAVRVWERVK